MKIRSIIYASMAMFAAVSFVACGEEKEPEEGDVVKIEVGDEEMEMVYVAPGSFRMGATTEQDGFDSFTELPAHDVTITKGYYIGRLEVTQAQWEAVMGKNPSDIKQYDGKEDKTLPVANITWADAVEFTKKLSSMTGKSFRLPTEAEWEYAARGASKTYHLQYSGSKYLDRVACFRSTSNGTPHPVGQYMPNELDMRDMNGNVSEWVADNFATYKDSAQVDPFVNISDTLAHVARGGSFISTTTECRTASRENYTPEFRSVTIGLRVAMDM